MSNSLDPDKAPHFVGPDLCPNCLQRLPEQTTLRDRVNLFPAQWTLSLLSGNLCHLLEALAVNASDGIEQ